MIRKRARDDLGIVAGDRHGRGIRGGHAELFDLPETLRGLQWPAAPPAREDGIIRRELPVQNGQRLGHAADLDVLGDFVEAKPGFEEDGPILVRSRIEAAFGRRAGAR